MELRSLDDPEWGDPAEWPERTDDDAWELGPEPLPYEADSPPDPWPTPDEIAEYEAWLDHLEHDYPATYPDDRLGDDDLRAAGLPVG